MYYVMDVLVDFTWLCPVIHKVEVITIYKLKMTDQQIAGYKLKDLLN